MLTLLHDHRTISIVMTILIIFAGLYTYQGLIGRPGGLLRQLLVGIPAGVVFGVGNYFFDVAANHVLSNTFRELVQSPAIPVSSITIGVLGFVLGLTLPLLSPNYFRFNRPKSEWQRLSIPTIVLLFLVSVASNTLWNSIGILVIFHLFSFYPPLLLVIAAAFVLSTIGFIYSSSQLHLLRPTNDTSPSTPQVTFLGCIVNLIVLVPTISLTVYLVWVIGWGALVYFGITVVAGVLLWFIQLGVDKMADKSLLELSLVLFLLASVLQLYQVILP